MSRPGQIGKRALDIAGAGLGLALLAPLLLGVAAFIRLRSPGPVFFVQARIGRGLVPFGLVKFRTMDIGAERAGTGTVTLAADPRVFPGAGFLRRHKIDELPQLWNVLRGEMSLVGPRPTVAADYARMTPRQRGRAAVRPGLTGQAQISGNTALNWSQRIEHDLAYIARMSPAEDLRIIAATVRLVLSGRAETHPPAADEWAGAGQPDDGDLR